jgi:hypothetical protein
MGAEAGSGKISSSPLSTASKMASATDSGEAFGMSDPRVIRIAAWRPGLQAGEETPLHLPGSAGDVR